jgi:hypothetical protein
MTAIQTPLLEDSIVQFSVRKAAKDHVDNTADKLGVHENPKDLVDREIEETSTLNNNTLTDTIMEKIPVESKIDAVEPEDKVGGVLEPPILQNTNPPQTIEEKSEVGSDELSMHALRGSNKAEDEFTEEKMAESSDQLKKEGDDSSFSAVDLLASEQDVARETVSQKSSAKDELNIETEGSGLAENDTFVGQTPSTTDCNSKTEAISPPDVKPSENSATEKMKFEVVNVGGKFCLTVTGDTTERTQESKSNETKPASREKSKVKRTKSGDKAGTRVGKQRNKVISPITPKPGQPRPASQKPLMDLRHILKKHERKSEVLAQPVHQVDFYGSMSAIPFLKKNKEDDKKQQKKKAHPKATAIDKAEITDKESGENVGEKQKLPSKEEITVTAEYDEVQLHLWKSMSALDNQLEPVGRPQEMLPLRPGILQKKKKEPLRNSVRAFNRPEDWINCPELRSPTRGYRVSAVQAPPEEDTDILVMEPEDSLDGHQPPPRPPLVDDRNDSLERVV